MPGPAGLNTEVVRLAVLSVVAYVSDVLLSGVILHVGICR